jgi:hypothetical protein
MLQTLSVDQIKALNKLPFEQWKNLSSDSLKNYFSKIPIDKLVSINDQLSKLKELNKKRLDDLRNANNPEEFLKSQSDIDFKAAANAVISIVLPLLIQFINSERSANLIVNKLINDSKKQLRNKGSFVVINGAITFTPLDNANYQRYKDNFDRRVKTLKNIVKTLKNIVDNLLRILRLVRIALTAFQVLLSTIDKKQKAQAIAASAEQSSPSPTKPLTAKYLLDKEISQIKVEKLKQKIDKYTSTVDFILAIIPILQNLINNLKIKLDQLSFTITSNNQPLENISNLIDNESSTETEYDVDDKTYIIKVITTLSGALQAIAYDKFSNLKITQTAPSKIRKANELIDELKQILG